jgi:hypothetical protein
MNDETHLPQESVEVLLADLHQAECLVPLAALPGMRDSLHILDHYI